MQTELATLKGLWNKAASSSAKARLLAGFSEEVRRELYRQTGDADLLEGLAKGHGDKYGNDNGSASSHAAAVSGPLQLCICGQILTETLDQQIERAKRKAEKRAHRRAVKRLAREWERR